MSTPNTPPACYRHSGAPARVACTRCNRPICPDCMTTAAVGFQCPDCVQEGKKSVRAVRTVFGGRVHDGRPLVTYTLMAACAVVGVLQIVIPGFTQDFSMWPLRVAFFDQWYRMITSGFLHYGVVHLLFNMWALYVVGPPLESWLGRARFSVLYGVSLLGGSTLIYLMAPLNTAHAGASGAIFGLFAATYVVAKRLQFDVRSVTMLRACQVFCVSRFL